MSVVYAAQSVVLCYSSLNKLIFHKKNNPTCQEGLGRLSKLHLNTYVFHVTFGTVLCVVTSQETVFICRVFQTSLAIDPFTLDNFEKPLF